MPKYKKKKHNRILSAPPKRVKPPKRAPIEDIPMKSYKEEPKKSEKSQIRVVKGKKLEHSRRTSIALITVSVILVIFLCFQLILPAGIFQTAKNLLALVGTGNYPITVSGSQTLAVETQNNYYFHLTDTHICGYSSAGKVLFSTQHGFDKPILSASKGKAIVYNQGGQHYSIFDLNGNYDTFSTEEKIICASISDSGTYAVATYSKAYASAVSVFSKRNSLIFEWYSAEDTINNIALSSNGNKLALSTFNSASGLFNSRVNIINFKSATPEFTQSYENCIIYGLSSTHKTSFCVIKSNGIDFIRWSNYKKEEFKDDYKITYFRKCGSAIVSVFNRDSDKTDNKIVILNPKGKVKTTVSYNGIINDIRVKGSNIYCINDSDVAVLDFNGDVKFTAKYGYGGTGLTVISTNVVAVITDSEIKRIKLN